MKFISSLSLKFTRTYLYSWRYCITCICTCSHKPKNRKPKPKSLESDLPSYNLPMPHLPNSYQHISLQPTHSFLYINLFAHFVCKREYCVTTHVWQRNDACGSSFIPFTLHMPRFKPMTEDSFICWAIFLAFICSFVQGFKVESLPLSWLWTCNPPDSGRHALS